MANTSLQIVEVPDFIEESSEYDIKYKRTAKWDAEKGDFVRDGAYRMVECSGEEGFTHRSSESQSTNRICHRFQFHMERRRNALYLFGKGC